MQPKNFLTEYVRLFLERGGGGGGGRDRETEIETAKNRVRQTDNEIQIEKMRNSEENEGSKKPIYKCNCKSMS